MEPCACCVPSWEGRTKPDKLASPLWVIHGFVASQTCKGLMAILDG